MRDTDEGSEPRFEAFLPWSCALLPVVLTAAGVERGDFVEADPVLPEELLSAPVDVPPLFVEPEGDASPAGRDGVEVLSAAAPGCDAAGDEVGEPEAGCGWLGVVPGAGGVTDWSPPPTDICGSPPPPTVTEGVWAPESSSRPGATCPRALPTGSAVEWPGALKSAASTSIVVMVTRLGVATEGSVLSRRCSRAKRLGAFSSSRCHLEAALGSGPLLSAIRPCGGCACRPDGALKAPPGSSETNP
jgi:hypothetical protein